MKKRLTKLLDLKKTIKMFSISWIYIYTATLFSLIGIFIMILLLLTNTKEKFSFTIPFCILIIIGIIIPYILIIISEKKRNKIIQTCDEKDLFELAQMISKCGMSFTGFEGYLIFAWGLHYFLENNRSNFIAKRQMLEDFRDSIFFNKHDKAHLTKISLRSSMFRQKIAELFLDNHKIHKDQYVKGALQIEYKKLIVADFEKDGSIYKYMITHHILVAFKAAVVFTCILVFIYGSAILNTTFFSILTILFIVIDLVVSLIEKKY